MARDDLAVMGAFLLKKIEETVAAGKAEKAGRAELARILGLLVDSAFQGWD
ncbi:hypothetical protein N9A94_06320 [Akkermansiaceae bacterium]|nr:hypothetical protein [Akkermansiaceae bacterium]